MSGRINVFTNKCSVFCHWDTNKAFCKIVETPLTQFMFKLFVKKWIT